jgi:hypothetical protein
MMDKRGNAPPRHCEPGRSLAWQSVPPPLSFPQRGKVARRAG